MKLSLCTITAAAAFTFPTLVNAEPTEQSQPNILFIIADDQQVDEVGFMADATLTPHIDGLAENGTYFSRSYVAASVCSPSRYTVLSGQYASRCELDFFKKDQTEEGVTRVLWNIGFSPDQTTLPMVLQDAGYMTGFVGKWHINGLPRGSGEPVKPGSDPADPNVIARLKSNQVAMSGGIQKFGFDYAQRIYAGNPHDDKELRYAGVDGHNMAWITEGGLEFIDQAVEADEPFFLYFSTTLPHFPPPIESIRGDETLTPVGKLSEPIQGVQPSTQEIIARGEAAGIPDNLWGAMWLDDGVGALMDKLEEHGIAENTLVIYFVDHGMANQSKGTCYEGGLVTPTIAHMPGTVPAGRVVEHLIQNTDFAPTFIELAGVEPPSDMVLDGESIVPLLKGGDEPVRESVYAEIGLTRSVTTADGWKYIAFRVPPSLERTLEERLAEQAEVVARFHEAHPWTADLPAYQPYDDARYHQMGMAAGGAWFERNQLNKDVPFKSNYFDADQLYNLNEDPLETTNLADDPAHAEKLAEMKAELSRYLDSLPGTFGDLKPTE